MEMSFQAVYEDGVLKPLHAPALADGETVRVSVVRAAAGLDQPSAARLTDAPLEDESTLPPRDLPRRRGTAVSATVSSSRRLPEGVR